MVNFMCELDWTKGCQTAGKTLFPAVSMRVFLKKICV